MKKWVWILALAFLPGCVEMKSIPVRLYPAQFEVDQSGLGTIRIMDAAGQTVRVLEKDKAFPVGSLKTQWDGRDDKGETLPAGDYTAVLTLARWDLKWMGAFGGLGAGPGRFLNPEGLCAYPQGARLTVAVADTGNQRVQLLTDTGAFLQSVGQFGGGSSGLSQPTDVDWDGLLLTVCDSQNQRLARFDSRGIYLGEVRQLTGVQVTPSNQLALGFQSPVFIQKGGAADFWVSDSGQGILFHITSTGGVLDELGSPFSLGNDGPFLQINGNYWIRTNKTQVQILNSTGGVTGSLKPVPAFGAVAGMAVSPQDFALVSDSSQALIYLLDGNGGVFQTLATDGAVKPTALSLWNDQLFLIDAEQNQVVHYQLNAEAPVESRFKITVGGWGALPGS